MPEPVKCYLCGTFRPPEEMLAVVASVDGTRIDFNDPHTFEADYFCLGPCARACDKESGLHKRIVQHQDHRAREKHKRLKEKKERMKQ